MQGRLRPLMGVLLLAVALAVPVSTASAAPKRKPVSANLTQAVTGTAANGATFAGTLEVTRFVPDGWDGDCDGSWIDNETFVARVNSRASRGRVVAIPASTSRDMSTWRELVPEGEGFMSWAAVIAGRLYVGDFVDLSVRVRVFDKGEFLAPQVALSVSDFCLITATHCSR